MPRAEDGGEVSDVLGSAGEQPATVVDGMLELGPVSSARSNGRKRLRTPSGQDAVAQLEPVRSSTVRQSRLQGSLAYFQQLTAGQKGSSVTACGVAQCRTLRVLAVGQHLLSSSAGVSPACMQTLQSSQSGRASLLA